MDPIGLCTLNWHTYIYIYICRLCIQTWSPLTTLFWAKMFSLVLEWFIPIKNIFITWALCFCSLVLPHLQSEGWPIEVEIVFVLTFLNWRYFHIFRISELFSSICFLERSELVYTNNMYPRKWYRFPFVPRNQVEKSLCQKNISGFSSYIKGPAETHLWVNCIFHQPGNPFVFPDKIRY